MGFNLYEIDSKLDETLEEAYAIAEENEGEIPEELAGELDRLTMERSDKISNIARYIKNTKAEKDAVGKEASRLNKRKNSLDNKAKWLNAYLSDVLKIGEKHKDSVISIYWSNRDVVDILNPDSIPIKYQKAQEPEFMKREILAALKNEELVDGAAIKNNKFIVIR